jgi:hypothetical protein
MTLQIPDNVGRQCTELGVGVLRQAEVPTGAHAHNSGAASEQHMLTCYCY